MGQQQTGIGTEDHKQVLPLTSSRETVLNDPSTPLHRSLYIQSFHPNRKFSFFPPSDSMKKLFLLTDSACE